VFFGGSPDSIDHVGLFVGVVSRRNVMVDAPHTGADVHAEAFPATTRASFGSLLYSGRRDRRAAATPRVRRVAEACPSAHNEGSPEYRWGVNYRLTNMAPSM
jgi:hypothetical protein